MVAAVWANNSQAGYFYNTTFTRLYKDGDQWGDSASFEDRDLPNLAKAAADVHTWIYQQKRKPRRSAALMPHDRATAAN